MPRLIDPENGTAIGLEDLLDTLETTHFDPHDEDDFAALGPLLARLGRNREFLADLALAELKARCARQHAANGYGPQVFLLAPPNGRYVVRANFWPALADPVVQASGTAAFFYDLPHDHNFPFLTYGYLGPGYWSDYYEYDGADRLTGVGEAAGLRFVERARLDPGKLRLYRMQRDIHVQLPPDAFSVSLNIIGQHASHPWIDQYRFDIRRGVIAQALTMAPSEGLVALAAHLGGENGRELVEHLAIHHPHPRMRRTAFDAITSVVSTTAIQPMLEHVAGGADESLSAAARTILTRAGV